MCLDEMYGGNATAYLSANPMQHLTGSPVCGECLDEFVHDIQNAHDGPMATMNQMLPPQQIPVLVGCLCEHSEELDADPQRAAPRILFGCVMRVGSNVALPPASRQQAEAAALALFDRSEPTAEASPSLNTTPDTINPRTILSSWPFIVLLGIIVCFFGTDILCCNCSLLKGLCDKERWQAAEREMERERERQRHIEAML